MYFTWRECTRSMERMQTQEMDMDVKQLSHFLIILNKFQYCGIILEKYYTIMSKLITLLVKICNFCFLFL